MKLGAGIIILMVMACSNTKVIEPKPQKSVEKEKVANVSAEQKQKHTELVLTGTYSIKSLSGYMPSSDDTSLVTFDDATGRLTAVLGCNNISGSYSLSDNLVTFSKGFIATRMYCEDHMGLEDQFNKVVPGSECTVSMLNNTVVFISPSGDELMRLIRK